MIKSESFYAKWRVSLESSSFCVVAVEHVGSTDVDPSDK